MQTEPADTNNNPEDARSEARLKALYRAALLDETFQKHIAVSLKSLPETDTPIPGELVFTHDERISPQQRERLQALTRQLTAKGCQGRCAWWKKLWRVEGWDILPLPGPGFSVPALLLIGVLLGALLPTLPTESNQLMLRQEEPLPSTIAAATCTITPNERKDAPTWSAAIQRCQTIATEQNAAIKNEQRLLRQAFPNHQSASP